MDEDEFAKKGGFLTIIHDVDGLPRAWGAAATEEASQAEAERRWTMRLAQRAAEGTTDRSEERGKTVTRFRPPGAKRFRKVIRVKV